MSGNLEPWVEYIPDIVQEGAVTHTRKARRRLFTPDGDVFFVQAEYDDGNGMWIMTGVSRDLSTD
jgi:hypothetical protein